MNLSNTWSMSSEPCSQGAKTVARNVFMQFLPCSLFSKNSRHDHAFIEGFYSERNLRWTLGSGSEGPYEACIPYSLAYVHGEGWLVGDEGGRLWSLTENQDALEEILEFPDGISDIAVQDSNSVLVGDMRGQLTHFDLNHLCEESIKSINSIKHTAPVKCVRWQPQQQSSSVFSSASQDGSVGLSDLRSSSLIASFSSLHSFAGSTRSTITGLVFHPQRPELFYTTGTPDSSVKLWDMRKLPSSFKKRGRKGQSHEAVEEFLVPQNSRRHKSALSLAIDSIGSRLFVATSSNQIFEFLTNNSACGPVSQFYAAGYSSCSFFSNLTLDPSDRHLLSGSADGNAYIWDTRPDSCSAYQLPITAQLEVSKTAWVQGRSGGAQNSQIGCIGDDLSFSIFNWKPDSSDETEDGKLRPNRIAGACREVFEPSASETLPSPSATTADSISLPATPIKQRQNPLHHFPLPAFSSPNKSILDFFPKSPQISLNTNTDNKL